MKPRVLIADDSLTVRMDLSDAFDSGGFLTSLCASISEARSALVGDRFAAIVLDVLLPDGDGIELLQEIRNTPSTANLPVILLSSESEVRDRIRGLTTGADEYVGKPYQAESVVKRTRELVYRRSSEPVARTSFNVLVIEDSITFRQELKDSLQTAGYSVITAKNGEEGLKLASTHRPDAIIVDRTLPGIDGPTVIRRLRLDSALRLTPCMLLTASTEEGAEVVGLEAGADVYLRKGSDQSVVLARLSALLRSGRAPGAHSSLSSPAGSARVLVVDDSSTYLNEISDELREEGYDVLPARSSEDAFQVLALDRVDCILQDWMMPGMSGLDICRRIKNSPAWRNIPLIMMSSRESTDALIEALSGGADDYISKSSELDVLKGRLRAQIRKKQLDEENRRTYEELFQRKMEAEQARAAQLLAETKAALTAELESKVKELEEALNQVKQLQGLLPICSFCKKIRNDKSSNWEKLETYIARHSEASFSHSICNECLEKNFPE